MAALGATHQQLSHQLQDEAATLDVVVLVKALQKSQQFERDLSARFHSAAAATENGAADEDRGLSTSVRIKQKYSQQKQRCGRIWRR